MGKPLVVSFGGADLALSLTKVDRTELYGSVEIETFDADGRRCTLGTLADDGRTVLGASSTAIAMLSPDGSWMERKSLIPTDNQGKPIAAVPSSYTAPVPLVTRVGIDEFMAHNIRSVYQVSSDGDLAPLRAELEKGVIFGFPYSFRGGLEADAGFLLLAADGTPFLAVGTPTKLDFVGLEQSGALTEEAADEEGEDIDFSMI